MREELDELIAAVDRLPTRAQWFWGAVVWVLAYGAFVVWVG